MKKSKMIYLLGVVTLLGGLVSCGGDSSSIVSNSSSEDGITIRFWHTFGQTITGGIESYIEKFQKLVKENEGVDVTIEMSYQGGYDDIENKIRSGFSTSNTPTIAVAYPDHVADYLSNEGTPGEYVVNLDDYIEDEKIGLGQEEYFGDQGKDDFVSAFMEDGQSYVNEGTYSFPFMKSTEVMFYNETLLSSILADYAPGNSGSDLIKKYLEGLSWDDFMNLNRYISEHMKEYSDTLLVPCVYDSDSNLYISHSYQEEIPFISIGDDGKGSVDFDNDEAKAMATELKNDYDDGCFTTRGIIGEYGSNYFKSAECVFSIGSSGGAGYQSPTNSTFDYDICKVPYENNNQLYVSQGPALTLLKSKNYTDAENKAKIKYAWKFLKYITSTEVNADLCFNDSEGYVPVRKSSYETDFYNELMEYDDQFAHNAKVVIEDINGTYVNTACFAGSAKARDEAGGILTALFAGTDTVDEAFAYAKQQVLLAM
ncbi:MAG: extracellular solute-binding protein [Bacteroidaceae bacterium]